MLANQHLILDVRVTAGAIPTALAVAQLREPWKKAKDAG